MLQDTTKIVLITGSSRGFGKKTALALAKKGVDDIGGALAKLTEGIAS